MLVARNAPPPPNVPASARLRWPRNAGACGNSLSQLERGGRFYRQDAGGGPVYLSDAELDAIRRELASRESERCR